MPNSEGKAQEPLMINALNPVYWKKPLGKISKGKRTFNSDILGSQEGVSHA